MSLTIGKEAREALQELTSEGTLVHRHDIRATLDRCTDAPEVGLPEGFPWTESERHETAAQLRWFASPLNGTDRVMPNQLARWLESAGQKESGDE